MVAQKNAAAGQRDNTVTYFWTNRWMVTAVLAGGALSIVSGFTTYSGMSDFLPYDILRLLATFGIQSLVFFLSFLVAHAIVYRRLQSAIGFLSAYIIAAVFSVVFSYAAIFNQYTTRQEISEVNRREAQSKVSVAINDIRNILEQREASAHANFLASKPYRDWLQEANEVIYKAQQSAGVIEKALQLQMDQVAKDYKSLRNQIIDAERDLNLAKTTESSATESIARLEAELDPIRAYYNKSKDELETIQAEIKRLEAAMQHEDNVGSTRVPTKSGKGPEYRRYAAEKEALGPKSIPKDSSRASAKRKIIRTRGST